MPVAAFYLSVFDLNTKNFPAVPGPRLTEFSAVRAYIPVSRYQGGPAATGAAAEATGLRPPACPLPHAAVPTRYAVWFADYVWAAS